MSATQWTQRTSSSYRCNDAHGSALRESLQLPCRLSGPYAMLRDCLNDEMATAIVAARKKQPFVSVGDCVSRIRKLGRTKLLKLEEQNISIPRQPPGRKPKDYKPPVGGGGIAAAALWSQYGGNDVGLYVFRSVGL